MTTRKLRASPAALAFADARALWGSMPTPPRSNDYRKLPPPLDVLGARLRAEMIWLGTRQGGAQ